MQVRETQFDEKRRSTEKFHLSDDELPTNDGYIVS
jgi:hypothetical protein